MGYGWVVSRWAHSSLCVLGFRNVESSQQNHWNKRGSIVSKTLFSNNVFKIVDKLNLFDSRLRAAFTHYNTPMSFLPHVLTEGRKVVIFHPLIQNLSTILVLPINIKSDKMVGDLPMLPLKSIFT